MHLSEFDVSYLINFVITKIASNVLLKYYI